MNRYIAQAVGVFALTALSIALPERAAAAAPAESSWVPYMPLSALGDTAREADQMSIQRSGPWVEFIERSRQTREGKTTYGEYARVAVNCLSGGWNRVAVSTNSSAPGPWRRTMDLGEVERLTGPVTRRYATSGVSPEVWLQNFACTCPSAKAVLPAGDTELRSLYDRYLAANLRSVAYSGRALNLGTPTEADDVLAQLAAGQTFDAVFAQHGSWAPKMAEPRGRFTDVPESELDIEHVRLLRSMQAGEHRVVPVADTSRWEVYFLDSRRELPAPGFEDLRERLQHYVENSRRCGWKP